MRQHICKNCGKIYLTDKQDSTVCPACAAEIKKDVLRVKVCAMCGKEFVGYPRSKYCAACRPIAQREANRRHKKNGTARPIGSTDTCANCGKPYIVNSSRQRYCPDCAKVVVPQNVKAAKRETRKEHADEINAARAERRKDRRICAVCGKPFSAPTPTVTCGAECAAELKRQRQARADVKRGKAKPERLLGKKERTAPQSGVPGVTWCRNKWQLTYKGNYIGVYDTVEAAKCKKLQLESGDANAD